MKNKIDINDSLYNIVNENPFLLDVLINSGIDKIKNKALLNTLGKNISLKRAIESKQLNEALIMEKIMDSLKEHSTEEKTTDDTLMVDGVLACPIRIPLDEAFHDFINKLSFKVSSNLKAASLGIDDIVAMVKTKEIDKIPDVILSAGFDLFFDKELMGHYIDENLFCVPVQKMNKDFDNEYISLIDKKGNYGIIGVVPTVMIVNKRLLNGRNIPQTMKDLLSPEYKDSISIPIKDLDLFNAIIINIYKEFGDEGIKALARNYYKSMHPVEMLNSETAISLCPYFFANMLKGADVEFIWPKDGAIISPIFLVAKKDKPNIEQIVEFFQGPEVGKILSSNGSFPSTNDSVNNNLPSDYRFKWLGWDYIYNNDIGSLLRQATKLFFKEIKEINK